MLVVWEPVTAADHECDVLEVAPSFGVPLEDLGEATVHGYMTGF